VSSSRISVRWNLTEFLLRTVLRNVGTCHQNRREPVPEQSPLIQYPTTTKLFESCVFELLRRESDEARASETVESWFDSPQKQVHLSPPKRPDWLRGPIQPHIQFILEINRPGREADHSLSINAESKYVWSYFFTPHLFHGV